MQNAGLLLVTCDKSQRSATLWDLCGIYEYLEGESSKVRQSWKHEVSNAKIEAVASPTQGMSGRWWVLHLEEEDQPEISLQGLCDGDGVKLFLNFPTPTMTGLLISRHLPTVTNTVRVIN